MAVIRTQVFFTQGIGNKWSNVYHLEADGLLDAAIAFTDDMLPALLSVLSPNCLLVKALFSSLVDDSFTERIYNDAGTNGDTDVLLPLFNSAKVLFGTASLGRPDYKFLKGLVTEDANENSFLASSVIGHIEDVFSALITAMSSAGVPLVSENGDLWASVSVAPLIQMRQMHRRRRRTTPTP